MFTLSNEMNRQNIKFYIRDRDLTLSRVTICISESTKNRAHKNFSLASVVGGNHSKYFRMKEIRIAFKERRIFGGRFSPLLGTLRSDNDDVHENVHEKWTSHPFTFFRDYPKSPSYLKRREFRLEMKRGECARLKTEMVEFLGLPFPSSSKLKLWSFHVVVVQGRQRNVQKGVMHVQSYCFVH